MHQFIICLNTASDPVKECEDYCGNLHDVGDQYLAPDGCNTCVCFEEGPACDEELCPS